MTIEQSVEFIAYVMAASLVLDVAALIVSCAFIYRFFDELKERK